MSTVLTCYSDCLFVDVSGVVLVVTANCLSIAEKVRITESLYSGTASTIVVIALERPAVVGENWAKICFRVTISVVIICIGETGACVAGSWIMVASLKMAHSITKRSHEDDDWTCFESTKKEDLQSYDQVHDRTSLFVEVVNWCAWERRETNTNKKKQQHASTHSIQ